MSDPPGDPASDGSAAHRAAEVYTAELRPRPGGRLRHNARVAGAFLSELFLQLLPAPSVHDVVVIDRRDGTEVLRVPVGEPLQAGDMLAYLRRQLDDLGPDELLAEWATPPSVGRTRTTACGRGPAEA